MIRRWFFLGSLLILSPLAVAHPHSFIDLELMFLVKEDKVKGVQFTWVLDEVLSSALLYDANVVNGGSKIWHQFTQEMMQSIRQANYLTTIYHDGTLLNYLEVPNSAKLAVRDSRAVLSFDLAFEQLVSVKDRELTVLTYEPTYYLDMGYADISAITLNPELIGQCQIELIEPERQHQLEQYSDMLMFDHDDEYSAGTTETSNLGKQFAQTVVLRCQ